MDLKLMNQISLIYPDDWHCHFRDGDYLKRTVTDTAKRFARAIVMPNLPQPIINVQQALDYRSRIVNHVPEGVDFTPLMTLYLTDNLSTNDILAAKESEIIFACKLYPSGATTHSVAGVKQIRHIYPILESMEKVDLPLLVHGEVTDPEIDIFEREKFFISQELIPIVKYFPRLRIIFEHISTKEAVEFVHEAPPNVGATITAHHLWYNRNALFKGGIRPHYYCLPILKHVVDQQALIRAAISGNPKFFLGTDSAPHTQSQKESKCGCAGIYSAHAALELYAEIFAQYEALDKLEAFASINGPQFYHLPINQRYITLEKSPWSIPDELPFGDSKVIPMLAGETLNWRICLK